MSHRSCMGKIVVCTQYRTMLLATLLSHLAACCSTSSVPGFSEVSAVATTVHSEFPAHLKTHNQENSFYFLILDSSPILALLCTPHASAMERILGKRIHYLQAFSNLKKAVQIYFFQKNKIRNMKYIRNRRTASL